jgi:hypothetical protein
MLSPWLLSIAASAFFLFISCVISINSVVPLFFINKKIGNPLGRLSVVVHS